MDSHKPRRRRRRSEMRLGVKTINYEATATQPRLSIAPVLKIWQMRGTTRLIGLVTLAMLGWAAYTLFTEPRFFVNGAEIHGNIAISAHEIYSVSGIDNQSIFWINPAKVVKRITSLPNIKSATLSVTFPAKVVIELVERRPELLWQTGETIWWVDDEGMIVPPRGDVSGMMRIIDDDLQPLEPGYQIDSTIVEGAQTLRMLVPDVSVVRYSRSQGLTVATPEGWPVYLGDGSEIRAKLVVLTALLADLEDRNLTPVFIDVRDPLRPFYRPQSIIHIGQPGQRQPALQPAPQPIQGSPAGLGTAPVQP
ncbi:MAG: FtsQ-type POTRA domain-containing protein [Anaerolineae bacterium]|nr:FtsQ-type POTRA domain-containing protein [Anaerolineae bacterium]